MVTGASGGIGMATAMLCAKEGARVAVLGSHAARVDAVVQQITEGGGEALPLVADVAHGAQVSGAVEAIVAHFGALHGAFNNAGIDGPLSPAADYPEDDFDRVIAVNLKGVWNCMRYQIPAMLRSGGGSIVNNASAIGEVGQFAMAPYCASKAGVIGLSKAAALDYGAQGIRVNALSPGVIETPMMQKQMADYDGLRDMLVARHPIGRLGRVDEIAQAAVWMLSDRASFMLGTNMAVDGGYLAL